MKYCRNCGNANSDAMSFCGQCGARFNETNDSTWNQGDIPTASFEETPTSVRPRNVETETFQRNLAAPETPKSSKKIFLILGGIVALFFLVIAGIGGIGALFYYKSGQTVVVNNSNTTNRNVEKSPSPNVSPEKSATPQAIFTPPTEPTKKGDFTIYANTGWQLSDIDTISQEKFTTSVVGKIDLDGIKTGVSSSGIKDEKTKSRRIYPEFPTGALLMRTRYADGKYSNIAALTANGATGQWENYPGESGRIEFCINDNAPEKNGGQFTVTVNFVSAPKN
ncbi:MAG TPA: hypothetical protein PKY59_12350 [Pyrinomonadaceae bacterium]|nr:hypothetical protein [Pyrinomonadaceae bacterium]